MGFFAGDISLNLAILILVVCGIGAGGQGGQRFIQGGSGVRVPRSLACLQDTNEGTKEIVDRWGAAGQFSFLIISNTSAHKSILCLAT